MPYPLSTKLDSTLRYFNGLYGLATNITTQIAQALSDAATATGLWNAHIGSTGSSHHGAATASVNGFMTTTQVNTLSTASATAAAANTAAANANTAAGNAQTAANNAQTAVDSLLLRTERSIEQVAITSLRETARFPNYGMTSFACNVQSLSGIYETCAVHENGGISYGDRGRALGPSNAAGGYAGAWADVCCNDQYPATWVAVGASGQIQSGIASGGVLSWTQRRTSGSNLNAVAWGNNLFVAVGANNTLLVADQATLGTWTAYSGPFAGVELAAVLYVPTLSLWVVTSRDGRIATATTPSGTWTQQLVVSGTTPVFNYRSLQWSSRFGIVALYRRSTGVGLAYSNNGTLWNWSSSYTSFVSFEATRFALLDRSIVIFDGYTSPIDTVAWVYQSVDMSGGKVLGALAKTAIKYAANAGGQLVVCGNAANLTTPTNTDGVMLMSPSFRPNTVGAF